VIEQVRQTALLHWLPAIREPSLGLQWDAAQWETVIRLARRLRLLGRLAEGVASQGLLDRVPIPAARHLQAEQRFAHWRSSTLVWALERLPAMLGDVPYPLVLLKGAAYMGQDLPIGRGRLPSDVDILVPQAHIADAQARLKRAGWEETPLDAHDQRYYREWSHELPPMRHPLHGLELDLSHNILPPVARTRVDADLLLERLQPSRWPAWQVLAPVDQVLHSAAHLFHDSELRDRLRDLVDLDGLLRHFGAAPGFWNELAERAFVLGLQESLALALHFCTRWLATPVPPAIVSGVAARGLPRWKAAGLVPLFEAVLWPTDPDSLPSRRQALAAQMLLVRHHLGRMPLKLLLPHLWHKMRTRPLSDPATPAAGV
jgi:hypothetical protein